MGFFGVGVGFDNCFGVYSCVVEQLSFSLFLLILTFDFDLIFGSFLTFWALTGYFWGWRRIQKMFLALLM